MKEKYTKYKFITPKNNKYKGLLHLNNFHNILEISIWVPNEIGQDFVDITTYIETETGLFVIDLTKTV